MELHVFEQAVFHKKRFFFYFWSFFVFFTVMLRASQRHYAIFEDQCKQPRHYGPYSNSFFRDGPEDNSLFRFQSRDRDDQYYDENGCWFRVQNYSNVSVVISNAASECTTPYNPLYQHYHNHTHFYLNSATTLDPIFDLDMIVSSPESIPLHVYLNSTTINLRYWRYNK